MLYFKNAELAETHHVSVRTVLNWIEAAKQGKLDLTLHEVDGRSYVSNTARNIATIDNLVEVRRKYRNTRSQKTVTPKPEFYKLYNQQQILDIVSSLDIYREIPHKYTYFDGGAELWDAYMNRLASETAPNSLSYTLDLLNSNDHYIDDLLSDYKRVNVIDIGVGNALPVKDFLARLLESGKLGKYIAIDISTEMLNVARKNIFEWFKGKVSYEGYEYDITNEKFQNLLAGEYIARNRDEVVNVVLILGGTFNNLRNPDTAYRLVHDSMNKKDILIHAQKLDTEASRKYFDFSQSSADPQAISTKDRMIIDLLNIDKSCYDVEAYYDEQAKERSLRIRLKVSLSIAFRFDDDEFVVNFDKDDAILVWRARHQNVDDILAQLKRSEFSPLHMSQSKDQGYILTISRIEHN